MAGEETDLFGISGQVFVQDQLGRTNAGVGEAGGLPTSRLFREARAGEGQWPGVALLQCPVV
jgi:hypothetical protein